MTNRKFFALVVCLLLLFASVFGGGCGGGVNSLGDDTDNQNNPNASGYVVTFDSQGGSYIDEQIVEAGKTATVPEEPEKNDNSFMGWYTAEGFSFRFDFNTPISRDITLYAKWWSHTDTTDTDGDGLIDSLEITYGTDPNNPDTDDDGLTDFDELNWLEYNPLVKDTDGNGINDGDEDADGDKLTNIQEGNYETNMIIADTDHDGLTDYEEVVTYKTDPLKADTDGDGVNDGTEIAIGSNPLVKEETFSTTLESNMTDENPQAIDISVTMRSSAEAAGSLKIMPADYSDNPLINSGIPGYLAAYNISADSDFNSATITFTLGSEVETVSDTFQPAVYYFNEATGTLEKVENQRIEGNKIIAEVSHFSIYGLINQVVYNEVWSIEIRPPSSSGTAEENEMNIVFVIDYSASMEWNDSQQLFKGLSKSFVDNLRDGKDKAAVVKFIRRATTVSELTSDKTALKSAIDSIVYDDGYGTYSGTDGSTGFYSALNILDSSQAGYKYVIFITDGEDNGYTYSYSTLIQRAKNSNVVVYTIGMGSAVESTLRQIASGTGGKYYKATTDTSATDILNLNDVFKEIETETLDMVTDSNNDGISDYYTNLLNDGTLPLSNGSSILVGVTDMFGDSDDWDGDGLKNGEEIKIEALELEDRIRVTAYMNSNPILWDTDFDGYNDYKEVKEMNTSPLKYTIAKGDADKLIDDKNFPNEYLNASMPDSDFIDTASMYAFAGDVKKRATETLIDYFQKYATSEEVLSRDAFAYETMQFYRDKYDTVNLVSDVIKLGKTFTGLANNIGSNTYTQDGRDREMFSDGRDREVFSETVNTLEDMIKAKKLDIDNINAVSKQNAINAAVSIAERKILLRSMKNNTKAIISNLGKFSENVQKISKAENWTQTTDAVVKLTNTGLSITKTVADILNTHNSIELPCKWNWMKKMSDFNKDISNLKEGKGGKIVGFTIKVVLSLNELQENYYEVAAIYGQIAANCYEYQKHLDILKKIANDDRFSSYVRSAASDIAEMFDDSGNPDWEEFENKLEEAQKITATLTTLKVIGDLVVSTAEKQFLIVVLVHAIYDKIMSRGVTEGYEMLVEAQVYYSIVEASRALLRETTDIVNNYLESNTEGDEASKYAVQLAQCRILGIDKVKSYLLYNGKLVSWLIRGITNRTKDTIKTEYEKAIENVYDIAEKCNLTLSDQLPHSESAGGGGGGGSLGSW